MNGQNYANAYSKPFPEQDVAAAFMEECVQRTEKPAGITIPYIISTAVAIISAIACLVVGVANPDARMTWAIILLILSAVALGVSIAGHVINAQREHPRNWVIASTLSVVFAVSMALMLLLFGAGRAIGDFATGTTETVSGVAQGIGETAQGIGETAQDIGNAAAAVSETADGFRQDVSETAKTVENVAHGVNDAREGVKSTAQELSGIVPDSDDPADAERVLNELPKSAEEVQEDAAQVREGVKSGVEGLIMGLFGKN